MRIEFTESEVETLPDSLRERLEDNVFEGSPEGIIEDVSGLKSALEKQTKLAKRTKTLDKVIELTGSEDVVTEIEKLQARASKASELAVSEARLRIHHDIATAGGDAALLIDKMVNSVSIDSESGEITVPGANGVPLEKDDGTKKTHIDLIAEWKADPAFDKVFVKTKKRGSGGLSNEDEVTGQPTEAPPLTTRVSEMTTAQKIAGVREHGSLERYRS